METDAARDLVIELMDGRTLIGKFDPARRVIKTSGAIKAEIYLRNKDVKAWYLAVADSAKSISTPEVPVDNVKPILDSADPLWKAKSPPYRLSHMGLKEAGEYQQRFLVVQLDPSSLESWDADKKGDRYSDPLILIDGKEEGTWCFGFPRNSLKLVLNEPLTVSSVGIAVDDYWWSDGRLRTLQIEVNEGTPVEIGEPKVSFKEKSKLYLNFKQPAQIKSLKLVNLNGGENNSYGLRQIYFLRDKKLQKMLDGK